MEEDAPDIVDLNQSDSSGDDPWESRRRANDVLDRPINPANQSVIKNFIYSKKKSLFCARKFLVLTCRLCRIVVL